jgi:hypothetical protein
MTTTNTTMTMGEMMDATMSQLGLRAMRAYRSSVRSAAVDAWIVDVTTETSIVGTGTGATFEAALAFAVESTRQSAGRIHYLAQRDGAV